MPLAEPPGWEDVTLDPIIHDASRYVGISFKAKTEKGTTAPIRFKVGDVNTHPDHGICKDCWNHWGKNIFAKTRWTEHKVLFSELKQADGWGDPRPASIVPDKLYSLDFSLGGSGKFDVWIDDIRFLVCQ